jgi:hypothetical protein
MFVVFLLSYFTANALPVTAIKPQKFSRVRHVVILFSTKLPPQLKLPVHLVYVTLGLQSDLDNCHRHITSLRAPPCC